MAQFYPLTVTDISKTTRDAVVLTLAPPADARDVFAFTQGQYLTFSHVIDGVELRRSYSICAGVDDGILQVGVKAVDGGAFSNFVNGELQVGDTLSAMPPMGQFHVALDAQASRHYLAFAGGSGITPILSILRSVLSREPASRFTLIYANQSPSSIMFREEIEDLKNLNMERLAVTHILESDSQDIDFLTGRIDAEKCAQICAHLLDIAAVDVAFICGPEPMMLTIKGALMAAGLTREQIKFELFASAQTGRIARKPAAKDAAIKGTTMTVTLDGERRSFEMGRDQTVLEAALANSVDAPHACKAGVCSTCKAKVLEGEVDMVANHALEDYEVTAGFVLTCQCYPLSDRLVVDYDQ